MQSFSSFSGWRCFHDLCIHLPFSVVAPIIVLCLLTFVGSARSEETAADKPAVLSITAPASSLPVLPQRFTLAQSVDQALKGNPQIGSYYYRVQSAAAESGIAFSQMLPSATLSYGRSSINNVNSEGAVDTDYIDQDSTTASLQINQPLFAGKTLFNGYQKALLNEDFTRAQKSGIENQMILDVQSAFLDLLKYQSEVRSLLSAVQRLQSSVESVRAYEQVRLAPYVDLLQAEVELADAQQRLSKAEIQVLTGKIYLNALLGLPSETPVEYLGDFNDLAFEVPWTQEQAHVVAMNQRPDILVKRKTLAMAEKEAEIVYGRFLPRVDLQGSYYDLDRDFDNSNTLVDRDYQTRYWTAGINLQWRVMEGGRTYYEHQRAVALIASQREELRNITDQVSAQVTSTYLSLTEARQRIATASKALGEATEGLERSQVRFEARVATVVEVLDAQSRLTRAESNHIQAQADFQKALAQLLYAMGERNPSLRF